MINYICAKCGGRFEKVPGQDEKALAEFERLFAGHDIELAGVVCDDCYRALMAEIKPDAESA